MEVNKTPKPVGAYWIAAIFIAVGVLLLGKNLNIISYDVYRIFVSWQMLLIVIGVNLLTKKQMVGSIILIATGVYFLMPKIHFFNDVFANFFWPVVLIITGLLVVTSKKNSMFRNNHRHHHQNSRMNHHTQNGFVNIDNSFSSTQEVVTEDVFKGGIITNSFGSVVLDLRRTTLEPGTTYLDLSISFGGAEIYIPSNWVVKSELQTSLGGYEDSRISGLGPIEVDKILVLRGSVSFSGVEVKS
ncbi:LiaI-LiaF-like domain-containing protein [Bacteroides sp. 519]|uniref:LiaF transmembrane domain-containing protein n=1 Tax=Bacteroides sp. 519 TaxID=2302937 RepID=UPI0013D5F659|nr:DUF5668 domain-containing protein [Bacteroides sp. 519]NDV58011.1 hypothetical protein [Bacteroides sp. 519]